VRHGRGAVASRLGEARRLTGQASRQAPASGPGTGRSSRGQLELSPRLQPKEVHVLESILNPFCEGLRPEKSPFRFLRFPVLPGRHPGVCGHAPICGFLPALPAQFFRNNPLRLARAGRKPCKPRASVALPWAASMNEDSLGGVGAAVPRAVPRAGRSFALGYFYCAPAGRQGRKARITWLCFPLRAGRT
jgi:hypothetical protein